MDNRMTVPDVFFQRTSSAKLALRLGPVTFTDSGGNGFIDAGEQVQLRLPLRDYVTNPVSSPLTGTGVSGTLSTATPGVTLVQATSTYAAIAPGQVAPNAVDFVLQPTPTYVPGTPLELKLAVESAQGSTELLYIQPTGTPLAITLLAEDFDSVAPGSLPAGWSSTHGAGGNTVPWTTNNTFLGTASNAAFQPNADDGPPDGSPTRWERLYSPPVSVPSDAANVTLDFDLRYDTEDDPFFNILAFDGLFLQIRDLDLLGAEEGIGVSYLAEAFAEEFRTGSLRHYPKHLPRSSDPDYFELMSVWAGDSGEVKHVHLKLPGMASNSVQLRFEYTQDSSFTCGDVRPGHSCGVGIDNVVLKSVVIPPVSPWDAP